MSLSVLVKSASGLPNVERFSKSDPMCVIILEGVFTRFSSYSCDGSLNAPYYHLRRIDFPCNFFLTGKKKETKVIDNNLDPEWNEVGHAGKEGARFLTRDPY